MNCKTISSGSFVKTTIAGVSFILGIAVDHFYKYSPRENNQYVFYFDKQKNPYSIGTVSKTEILKKIPADTMDESTLSLFFRNPYEESLVRKLDFEKRVMESNLSSAHKDALISVSRKALPKILLKDTSESYEEYINRLTAMYLEKSSKITAEDERLNLQSSLIEKTKMDHADFLSYLDIMHMSVIAEYEDFKKNYNNSGPETSVSRSKIEFKQLADMKEKVKQRRAASNLPTTKANSDKSNVRTNITPENIGVIPEEPKTSDPDVIVKD